MATGGAATVLTSSQVSEWGPDVLIPIPFPASHGCCVLSTDIHVHTVNVCTNVYGIWGLATWGWRGLADTQPQRAQIGHEDLPREIELLNTDP